MKRYTIPMILLVSSLLSFVGCTMLAPPPPQVAPEAANWQTWVLTASDELRPDAPPDQAATQAEIAEIKALAEQRDGAALAIVRYWDAGSPAYRWVQLADEQQKTLPAGPLHGRTMSLITVAMYDALIAAWDAKYTYNRPRPNAFDATLTTLITPPHSPAYPSEHAVVAGAVWDGVMPEGPGHFTWRGNGPAVPMAGTWQTWLLTSNDQLRPPPPPAHDSPERAAEIDAIKIYTRTFASNTSAFFWQSHPGIKAYWFDNAHRLLFENNLDQNPPYAALVYATVSVEMHDAFVACFEAKYTYWTIRPSQLDPAVVTPFPHPNHPSYPAAHGCNSGAGSTVLSGFFPADREALIAAGQEATESRFWAGIHYKSDNEAGWEIGRAAGQLAADQAKMVMQP